MITTDLFLYSLRSLWKRKLRSFLTILSVFLGIAAITTLISFGAGISSYVTSISDEMGKDKLIVQPRGFGFGPSLDSNVRLDETDLEAVRDVHGVAEATGVYMLSGEIEYKDKKKYGYVMGSDYADYAQLVSEIYTLDLIEGKLLRGKEKTKVLLGYNYQLPEKVFQNPVKLHDKILINGKEFEVAGFYEAIGNPVDDSNIYMTLDAAEEFFGAENYNSLFVRAAPGQDPTTLTYAIREELRDHRHQTASTEDFFVQTFEQVIATFSSILSIITGAVILIAFISVFVAAVNIMNTMYTSILERTKEIGIFKAIGSRNRDILIVFMLESGVLSFIGGILGVLLGYGVSTVAGNLVVGAGYGIFKPLFSLSLVFGSLVFAFLVGLLSGFLPAKRASQLKPVEALRYD